MKKIVFVVINKKALALFSLFVLGTNLFAQEMSYGVHAGFNLSKVIGNEYQVYDVKYRVGWQIGGNVKYTTKNNVQIGSGLEMKISKDQFAVMSDYASVSGRPMTLFPIVRTAAVSVGVPVSVGYKIDFMDFISLIPNIGVYASYGVASLNDDVQTRDSEGHDLLEQWKCYDGYGNGARHIKAFNRFSFAPRIGLDVLVSKHYMLSIAFQKDVTKLSRQYGCKMQSLTLNIGYSF